MCGQKLPTRIATVSVAKEVYQFSVLKLAGRACTASAWLVPHNGFMPGRRCRSVELVYVPVVFPGCMMYFNTGAEFDVYDCSLL